MHLLWLTLADPNPPDNGQFLYSESLIRGVAAAGAEVQVIGLARPHGQHRDGERSGTIQWALAEHRPRPGWASLASLLPVIVCRTMTTAMRRLVNELGRGDWDAIVFDSIVPGWALASVLAVTKERRPKIIYVSHNFEEGVARRIAKDEPAPMRRLFRHLDGAKMRRIERGLVRAADLVTANTPEDCEKFQAGSSSGPVLFVPPGYRGHEVPSRTISNATPRRAIIVGSYDWVAKRTSLEAFLEIADPLFARAGVELFLVGNAEESFLASLRSRFASVTCTGRVADITPYLADARVALVPDQLGGFKLKSLDYVFNRVPILGIEGCVPGLPLSEDNSILLFPDHAGLAAATLAVIDDFDRLNSLQDRAYAACRGQFDITELGRRLLTAIAGLDRPADAVPRVGTGSRMPA